MNERHAALASITRLHEIQDNVSKWKLEDATWAEVLIKTPEGDWTQAFRICNGRVSSITEPMWVPRSAPATVYA